MMYNFIQKALSFDDTFVASLVISLIIAALTLIAFLSNPARVGLDCTRSVVVITGCDSGFGLGLVEALSALGYRIIATCMTDEGMERIRSKVAVVIRCDVTKDADIETLRKAAFDFIASNPTCFLWCLVNNAGIAPGGFVDWTPMELYRIAMEVNYFAPIRIVKELLPLLKRTRGSRIVNLSSVAGVTGSAMLGPYCASKHALEGMGKALKDELAPWGIHVCHINPSFMNTNMVKEGPAWAKTTYERAPKEVAAQYSEPIFDALDSFIALTAEDKSLVVNAIVDTMTLLNPRFWRFPGIGAKFIRLNMFFPRGVQELLMGLLPPFMTPRPEVLQMMQG